MSPSIMLLIFVVSGAVGALIGLALKPLLRKQIGKDMIQENAKQGAVEIERIKAQDRAAARESWERVVLEKIDVIKTALAMGYSRTDIDALDSRLEQLIGRDKLTELQSQDSAPDLSSDLLDTDLAGEIERLRQSRGELD